MAWQTQAAPWNMLSGTTKRVREHNEALRNRERRETVRRAAEAAAKERLRLGQIRAGAVSTKRKQRGTGTRCPTLPSHANIDDKQKIWKMAMAYRAARSAVAYRVKRGKDAQDVLSTAADLMEQWRAFVAECLAAYYTQDLNLRGRFPTFPAGHAGV